MATFSSLAIAYLLGGLTFVPLAVAGFFLWNYTALPKVHVAVNEATLVVQVSEDGSENLKQKLQDRSHEPDVAASYFAVCREYVPGGVNGKPPERSTPAGETIAAESPSVYQSMYRSIFDRAKTQAPSIEGGKIVKKPRNVFYVVLRHGHLMLFDTADQLEVRHVIAVAHYSVDLYNGGDRLPEGELYIKRNCIRLQRKASAGQIALSAMPFYLFCDNCSEKEDFYHALLHTQERKPGEPDDPPQTQLFETDDVITLIRQLHASEEIAQTRWLNALIGRLFLAMYKTSTIENFVRNKINKKISRVAKPAIIKTLRLGEIDMGNSAPFFTNLKLREMTVDGSLIIEADVRYSGNFKLVIAAVARIELGSHFKAREVDLVLAGILKKLDGHVLVRIKPPPSNRIWLTFETMPKLDMSIEPVVSSRQITYSIVLRAIESRIREVLGETLVMPNWDDISFTNTENRDICRGGIWKETKIKEPKADRSDVQEQGPASQYPELGSKDEGLASRLDQDAVRTASAPDLSQTRQRRVKSTKSTMNTSDETIDTQSPIRSPQATPKMMRSQSFGTVANPVVTPGIAISSKSDTNNSSERNDATLSIKNLSGKSPEASPLVSPIGFLSHDSPSTGLKASSSTTSESLESLVPTAGDAPESTLGFEKDMLKPVADSNPTEAFTSDSRRTSISKSSMASTTSTTASPSASRIALTDRKTATIASLNTATSAAKKWGMDYLNRRAVQRGNDPLFDSQVTRADITEPIGRGQPLPPPGIPLPKPPGPSWSTTAFSQFKRKPVAPSSSAASTEGSGLLPDYPASSLSGSKTRSTKSSIASLDEGYGLVRNSEAPLPSLPPLPPRPLSPKASSSHEREMEEEAEALEAWLSSSPPSQGIPEDKFATSALEASPTVPPSLQAELSSASTRGKADSPSVLPSVEISSRSEEQTSADMFTPLSTSVEDTPGQG